MRLAVVVVVLASCDSGAPPVESKPAEVPRRSPHADATTIEAPAMDASSMSPQAGAGEPAPIPPRPRILTKGWLDQPAWPADGKELELAWLVSTELVPDKRYPDWQDAPLDLVATIGGVSRHAVLAPQFGGLKPLNQSACGGNAYPLEKTEVAKITFYEGGAGGYFVRRKGADVLEVGTWDQGDGLGDPRHETSVLRMHVPAKLKIHQAIFEVDAKGTRTPFDCSM
jgi:hypothetical protein